MTKLLKAQTGGHVALIDDEDFERCSKYRWYLDISTGYFYTDTNRKRLHVLIKGDAPDGFEWHHENLNKLVNTKENLKLVTHAVNIAMSKKSWNPNNNIYQRRKGWLVYIGRNNKRFNLGYFKTIEEARYQRDKFLTENFPDTVNPVKNFYRSLDPTCTFS